MPRHKKLRMHGVELERLNREAFKAAARSQLDCAVCGAVGRTPTAHHVIYEQHLRSEGLPIWNTANARRVCPEPCHELHHKGARRIKTKALTDENIEYAFYALGARAYDYLRRYYDDHDPDPRIVAQLAALEEAA